MDQFRKVVNVAVVREELINRFRRNGSFVQTSGLSEADLLKGTVSDLFSGKDDLGTL